ncbi:MAG TPA: alpha/beta fold hydrolase [Steroidobacteraceae bacterium]
MAARWSAIALGCQLLLGAGLAAALATGSRLSALAVAALVIGELCCVAFLLAAAPLALGQAMAAPGCTPRGRGTRMLEALWRDAWALDLALGRMALEPCRAPVKSPQATARSPAHPVMLVHGFACSRAVWRPLLARLGAADVGPVRAVSLEPLFAGIDAYAAQLLTELEGLGARSGGGAVTIVAHSMGGLVARAALRSARPGLVGRIITIGAPHHGTTLACCFRWPSAREMCPGSSWLAELNACQEGRLDIPMTTLYSLDDNYVVPAGSARFHGARAIELRGIGHLGLLDSKAVLGQVVSELAE